MKKKTKVQVIKEKKVIGDELWERYNKRGTLMRESKTDPGNPYEIEDFVFEDLVKQKKAEAKAKKQKKKVIEKESLPKDSNEDLNSIKSLKK